MFQLILKFHVKRFKQSFNFVFPTSINVSLLLRGTVRRLLSAKHPRFYYVTTNLESLQTNSAQFVVSNDNLASGFNSSAVRIPRTGMIDCVN